MKFKEYHWPENVKELQNAIERAVITSKASSLHFDLPREPCGPMRMVQAEPPNPIVEGPEILTDLGVKELKKGTKENIRGALSRTEGTIYRPASAAELLSIKPSTLSARISKGWIEIGCVGNQSYAGSQNRTCHMILAQGQKMCRSFEKEGSFSWFARSSGLSEDYPCLRSRSSPRILVQSLYK